MSKWPSLSGVYAPRHANASARLRLVRRCRSRPSSSESSSASIKAPSSLHVPGGWRCVARARSGPSRWTRRSELVRHANGVADEVAPDTAGERARRRRASGCDRSRVIATSLGYMPPRYGVGTWMTRLRASQWSAARSLTANAAMLRFTRDGKTYVTIQQRGPTRPCRRTSVGGSASTSRAARSRSSSVPTA